jgi:ribose transport system ATP-binding protein
VAASKTKPETVSEAPRTDATIRLANISKAFSGVLALRDVTVEFYPGEVHAILGENGAGKSTLMNIISGTLQPTLGEITFQGQRIPEMTPELSSKLGIAISFQHPAILEDLSVYENLRVALPDHIFQGRQAQVIAKEMLNAVGLDVPLRLRTEALTIAQKHLLELAKALALKPKLLILDEPTASLDQDATDMLFNRVREVVKSGTSVIYITHRLAEIRQIAQRITVLRDGKWRGTSLVKDITDADLLALIVGRTMGSAFPPKAKAGNADISFSVQNFSGHGFKDISFDVPKGQIIGIAGVAGNGQARLMRALAGLAPSEGTITLWGANVNTRELLGKSAYMPSDRHAEGLASGLTVRENGAFGALEKFATNGIVSRKKELDLVTRTFGSLAVKAPSIEAPILSLSGGNQQKIVMSRALLSEPGLIVADEPTQGVDVGARAEIYRILRDVSDKGTAVVVNSSDAAELEGLCDKVIVMSRGRAVATLTGADVTEEKIVHAAVGAGTHAGEGVFGAAANIAMSGLRHFLQTDNAPALVIAIATVLLGLYINVQNDNFLSIYNVYNILLLATALGFIALGQTVALLMGGIDLSVGPLTGFLVIIASFFMTDANSGAAMFAGFALMFLSALVVGTINGVLIRFANFTPIAATMVVYFAIWGCSLTLRNQPDGYISYSIIDWVNWQWGPIPAAFVVLCAIAIALEYTLRKFRPGWRLRAIGSNEDSARRMGIRVNRTFVTGYILSSLLTALGAIIFMAQIGVGDPRQGLSYTLASITAVVLGGTALTGGRGTFLGTVLGAVLLTEVLSAVTFLGLTQTYQYLFQGALIVVAALVYSTVRRRANDVA